MRGLLALIGAAAALLLAAGSASAAQVDYFLQIDGVQGPSTTMPGAIELQSFQWGASRGLSAPTGGAADREGSTPSVSEIVVTKNTDSATPLLLRASTVGQHFQSATLYVRKAGGLQEFLRYQLTNVIISSYHAGGHDQGQNESLTLEFTAIHLEDNNNNPGTASHASALAPVTGTPSSPWAPH